MLYSMLQIGTKNDDVLYITALLEQRRVAEHFARGEGMTKKEKQQGR